MSSQHLLGRIQWRRVGRKDGALLKSWRGSSDSPWQDSTRLQLEVVRTPSLRVTGTSSQAGRAVPVSLNLNSKLAVTFKLTRDSESDSDCHPSRILRPRHSGYPLVEKSSLVP